MPLVMKIALLIMTKPFVEYMIMMIFKLHRFVVNAEEAAIVLK